MGDNCINAAQALARRVRARQPRPCGDRMPTGKARCRCWFGVALGMQQRSGSGGTPSCFVVA